MVPGAFFGFEYTDRHITQNLPVNSTVISVSVQRLPNATYMAGLACDTDRHSSMIAALNPWTNASAGLRTPFLRPDSTRGCPDKDSRPLFSAPANYGSSTYQVLGAGAEPPEL
jgi:hypothetical protein